MAVKRNEGRRRDDPERVPVRFGPKVALPKLLKEAAGIEMWQIEKTMPGQREPRLRYRITAGGDIHTFDQPHAAWAYFQEMTGATLALRDQQVSDEGLIPPKDPFRGTFEDGASRDPAHYSYRASPMPAARLAKVLNEILVNRGVEGYRITVRRMIEPCAAKNSTSPTHRGGKRGARRHA
jgi:hypothetical protein